MDGLKVKEFVNRCAPVNEPAIRSHLHSKLVKFYWTYLLLHANKLYTFYRSVCRTHFPLVNDISLITKKNEYFSVQLLHGYLRRL